MLQRVYTRVSKPAARYSDRGSMAEHCSACRFFMSGGDCARVLGRVLPQGWCKYFSQEAVQRWNPLWPMAGIPAPPGATLDLSFLTSGSLDPRITFTRASTATYFNYAGVMQTAAINTPRWNYNPATLALQGLLLEDARTNTTLSSGNLGAAPWAPAATGAAPVVTANNAIAPDGTLTAARIVMPAVAAGANAAFVAQNTSAVLGQNACSMWLRGAVGGETVNLFFCNFSTYFHMTAILSTSWQRFSFVGTSTAGGWSYAVGTDMRDATQTPNPAQTFYAWGAQSEAGAFPTSYIPTTAAAVTRAQDQCIIPPANMGWFVSPGGSWQAEFILLNPVNAANNPRIVGTPLGAGGAPGPLFASGTYNLGTFDGTAAVPTVNLLTVNAVSKGASNWAPNTGRICLNGGAIASGAMTSGFGVMVTNGVAFLVPASPGGGDNCTGYMRRFRYWPRVLSDAEMQSVTT